MFPLRPFSSKLFLELTERFRGFKANAQIPLPVFLLIQTHKLQITHPHKHHNAHICTIFQPATVSHVNQSQRFFFLAASLAPSALIASTNLDAWALLFPAAYLILSAIAS